MLDALGMNNFVFLVEGTLHVRQFHSGVVENSIEHYFLRPFHKINSLWEVLYRNVKRVQLFLNLASQ